MNHGGIAPIQPGRLSAARYVGAEGFALRVADILSARSGPPRSLAACILHAFRRFRVALARFKSLGVPIQPGRLSAARYVGAEGFEPPTSWV